jgi:hypothetical protein
LPHNRHFEGALTRAGWTLAMAASLAAGAAAAGCTRRTDALTREDQRLVRELVAQARAALAAADSAGDGGQQSGVQGDSTASTPGPGGAALAAPLTGWPDSAGLELRLAGPWARLWTEPERGRRVLQAVHDSLQALRPVLFPPPPRPVPPASPDSTARPRVP